MRVPALEPGANIRRAGEDVRAGELVLARRHRARAGGAGRAGLARPRGAAAAPRARGWPLVVTGDELVAPGRAARPGPDLQLERLTPSPRQVERAGAELVSQRDACPTPRRPPAARSSGRSPAPTSCASRAACRWARTTTCSSALGDARRGGALLGRGAEARQADLVRRARRDARRSACRATRCRRWSPSSCSRGRRCAALQGADPARRAGSRAALAEAVARNPRRDAGGARAPRRRPTTAGRRRPPGPQGSHVLTSMLGADALALIPAGRRASWPPGERGGGGAPVRRSATRAGCSSATGARGRACRSSTCRSSDYAAGRQHRQQAGGRGDPARAPSSTGSGRPSTWSGSRAPTGASSRASRSGCCGCSTRDDSREVVLLTRPFVLLRFRKPGVRDRGRRRHGHLADRQGPARRARRARRAATCASPSVAPAGRRRHEATPRRVISPRS